jgi:hypothetical protein
LTDDNRKRSAMRKTTLHVWIAMLICIAAMATHAGDEAAPALGAASADLGR